MDFRKMNRKFFLIPFSANPRNGQKHSQSAFDKCVDCVCFVGLVLKGLRVI